MSAAASSTPLGLWEPRRQMTLEQARRRSSRVRLMRIGFTAAAAICAGIMIGHLAASALTSPSNAIQDLSGEDVVTMLNPRFSGRNVAGERFEITADTAQRRRTEPNLIDLVNPELIDETGTEVRAPSGLYDQDNETLELYEAVEVRDGKGYTFNSSAAKIDVREGGVVTGLEPLSGSGPLGDLRSDSYEIRDEGERVILRGNVFMTIYPDGRDGAARDGAPSADATPPPPEED